MVRYLCEAGADKDKAMADGATPLYAAAHMGHVAVVHALAEAGAKVLMMDIDEQASSPSFGSQRW